MDLLLQGVGLSPAAVEAFVVALRPQRVVGTVEQGAVRLLSLDAQALDLPLLAALQAHWHCDALRIDPQRSLADFRVLAMDMDSTLITVECIDEIAARIGKGDAVRAITAAAMRGELSDYADSLRRRVALLAGAPAAVLQAVYDERVRLSPGAEELLAASQTAGLKTLLVSGGFTFFTERLRERLGLDRAHANVLGIEGDTLTGGVSGPDGGAIIDAEGKATAVLRMCADSGCTPAEAIVIGDGANDLAMMRVAGCSVAYRAKPAVRRQADVALDHSGLDAVARLLSPPAAG